MYNFWIANIIDSHSQSSTRLRKKLISDKLINLLHMKFNEENRLKMERKCTDTEN